MPEYDVWLCFSGARTAYKSVESKGADLDGIAKPENGVSHLNRLVAKDKREAVSQTLAMNGFTAKSRRKKPLALSQEHPEAS